MGGSQTADLQQLTGARNCAKRPPGALMGAVRTESCFGCDGSAHDQTTAAWGADDCNPHNKVWRIRWKWSRGPDRPTKKRRVTKNHRKRGSGEPPFPSPPIYVFAPAPWTNSGFREFWGSRRFLFLAALPATPPRPLPSKSPQLWSADCNHQ
jgi:hypothetical protein